MGERLTFTVPGKPVPWQRVQHGRGHAYVPSRTRKYEAQVGLVGLVARQRWEIATGRTWPLDARYQFTARVFGARANADMSNVLKALEDGLNGVVWADDKQVDRPWPERCAMDAAGPRVECVVEVLP